MKYAVEMGSVVMIYIQSFIKISSGIQKLIEGYTDIQRAWQSHNEGLGVSLGVFTR
jgi:hypothetical protein